MRNLLEGKEAFRGQERHWMGYPWAKMPCMYLSAALSDHTPWIGCSYFKILFVGLGFSVGSSCFVFGRETDCTMDEKDDRDLK